MAKSIRQWTNLIIFLKDKNDIIHHDLHIYAYTWTSVDLCPSYVQFVVLVKLFDKGKKKSGPRREGGRGGRGDCRAREDCEVLDK